MALHIESLKSHLGSFLQPVASAASSLYQEELVLREPDMAVTTDQEFLAARSEGFLLTQIGISGDEQGDIALVLNVSNASLLSGKQDAPEEEAIRQSAESEGLQQRETENVQAMLGAMTQAFTDQLTSLHSVTLSFLMEDPQLVASPRSASAFFDSSQDRLLQLSFPMSLGEQELDPLYCLIPETLVDLSGLEQEGETQEGQGKQEEETPEGEKAPGNTPSADLTREELQEILDTSQQEEEEEEEGSGADDDSASDAGDEPESGSGEEAGKEDEEEEDEGEGVDPEVLRNTLNQSVRYGEEELGDLLGKSLELTEDTFTVKSKSAILSEHQDKLVVTKLLVKGERHGEIHALFSMGDAILLGGTLLMIPEEEINKKVKQTNFGDDEADAFGEIINIWTGALSKVFEEYYPRKLNIKKDRMEPMAPARMETESPDPFPDGEYLLVSYKMQFGTRALGNLEMVFPLSVLDITSKQKQEIVDQAKGVNTQAPPAVAILSENREANKAISAILDGMGFEICYITFRENIKDKIRPYNVAAVLLILEEVTEKNLAKLIKLQSLLRSKYPAIAAAPNWTRPQVIQAIKYGAQDIVNTPPDSEVVRNKFREFAPEQHSTVE
ncbi:MAG: hypothetical protein K9J48_00885 [Desulfohalobiaceae bacterium]|nr:hypothetical protein [Desulfohalobiaceae bacterium]MCF8085421.1 hypothetical protein [Desulfohalobiaceae bacterium]